MTIPTETTPTETTPTDLLGRVAVVTGGGTGIGAATAMLLVQQGAEVVVAGRSREPLEQVAEKIIAATGRRALAVPTDVRDEAAVGELVERTVQTFGRLDTLVNNAGGAYLHPFGETTSQHWDRAVDLNLRSAYLTTHASVPHIVEAGGGAIVNISSAAGVIGVKGASAYSAAKTGLQMFTRVIAAEYGPRQVRCNAIAVGNVASEGALRSWSRFGASAESVARTVPLRRAGHPDDIAWGVSTWSATCRRGSPGRPSSSTAVQPDCPGYPTWSRELPVLR